MSGVKNLRVFIAELCLGAMLLSGCGNGNNEVEKVNVNQVVIGNNNEGIFVDYSSEIPTGKIPYDKLNEYLKIVTLEYDGITSSFLITKNKDRRSLGGLNMQYDYFEYIDLKTGTVLIAFNDYLPDSAEDEWIIGGDLTIVSEKDITGYLLQEKFIKREYEISEILEFYDSKILPNLSNEQNGYSSYTKYEDDISYDELCKYGKVVKIENNGVSSNHFMLKEEDLVILKGSRCNIVDYIDLESKESMIKYHDYSDTTNDIWLIGEGLKILEEYNIEDYLLQENFIQENYTIQELVTFYKEKVVPTLNSKQKELTK